VLAVIPCSAPLGLVLGICALFVTLGGSRRGLVLAILSLPLAVVTGGCLGLMVHSGVQVYAVLMGSMQTVEPVLAGDPYDAAEVLAAFDETASDDLKSTLDAQALQAWATAVIEKHGEYREMSADRSPAQQTTSGGKTVILNLPARFINGEANVAFTLAHGGTMFSGFQLDDIDVEGISLREFAFQSQASAPEPPADEASGKEEQPEDAPEGEGG